jgi:hypothetical protein
VANGGHHQLGTTPVSLARFGRQRGFDGGPQLGVGREGDLQPLGLQNELISVRKMDERAPGALVGMNARDFDRAGMAKN